MSGKSAPIALADDAQPRRGAVAGIANRLQGSLNTGELSDIKFVVGRDHGETRTFPALKCILSLSSDVFYTMFHGSMPERRETIDIPEVLPEAFEILLTYLYTDKADLTVENVWPVLYCADKYDLPLLLEQCNQFLLKHIRAENCLTLLEGGAKWHPDDIVQLCFHVAEACSDVVFTSKEFASISRDTLQKLLESGTLRVDEHTVYKAVESWCVEACKRANQEASAANRRAAPGEALFLIRFPLLIPTQLADGPAKSGLLSEREQLDLYTYKLATQKSVNLPFSTEPRKPQPFRVVTSLRHKEFQPREEVFVDSYPFWVPAKVLGVHSSKLIVIMCKLSDVGNILLVEPGKLIRAADFLTKGRNVVWDCSGAQYASAVYHERSLSGHWVKARGPKEIVSFGNLLVKCDDAQEWKKVHDCDEGEASETRDSSDHDDDGDEDEDVDEEEDEEDEEEEEMDEEDEEMED
ncbi:BTB/POZ domain-containing protein 6-like [Paramacrobiotus metropolitanus]|uniref:BTB/POZ domain-containing protein 6-like n=1 Tax=Paramacrobiotus metropolitanus TaxID=2943436 RepID=UPI0024456AC2|nr:BTB/POZ domain-containing protein 6-like [Paramacrobiotus metropolitanus]